MRSRYGRQETAGQATLEYALLLAASLAVLAALAALWKAAGEGKLLDLAIDAASHGVRSLEDLLPF